MGATDSLGYCAAKRVRRKTSLHAHLGTACDDVLCLACCAIVVISLPNMFCSAAMFQVCMRLEILSIVACIEEAYSLALVHQGLGHVRIQLHIAGRILDDVPFQLPLHMGAVEGLLHQLVQAGVAVAEVLARQSPLIKPVYHLHTSQKTVHSFMHVDDN